MLAIMAVFASSVSAQLITSNRAVRGERSHNIWLDAGVSFPTNEGAEGTILNLGFRYNKMFTEYVGWDILKIGAQANTKDFGETISAEALTGIRGETPVLFGNAKAYANAAGGYLYTFDLKDGAFKWEVGLGLKLTPRFNIGATYESYSKDGFTASMIGVRLGVAL